MKNKAARNILLILLAFLRLGALFGGGVLVISPSSKLLGIPLSMLDNSPFINFLIPGIILFVVLGLVPCIVVIALLRKTESKLAEQLNFFSDMHWAWAYRVHAAFALIIWIQVEMIVLYGIHWSQTFYMFLAVVILFVTLLPNATSDVCIGNER